MSKFAQPQGRIQLWEEERTMNFVKKHWLIGLMLLAAGYVTWLTNVQNQPAPLAQMNDDGALVYHDPTENSVWEFKNPTDPSVQARMTISVPSRDGALYCFEVTSFELTPGAPGVIKGIVATTPHDQSGEQLDRTEYFTRFVQRGSEEHSKLLQKREEAWEAFRSGRREGQKKPKIQRRWTNVID